MSAQSKSRPALPTLAERFKTLLSACKKMADILEDELNTKGHCDPRDPSWSRDYNVELTLSCGEAADFMNAVTRAGTKRRDRLARLASNPSRAFTPREEKARRKTA